MSNYAVANLPLAYLFLAGTTFQVGWALAVDDGTADGAPHDVSDVTDVSITAVQRVTRGVAAPAPTIWTKAGGDIQLNAVTLNGEAYPYILLSGAAPSGVGVYDAMVVLTRTAGQDLVATCVFEFVSASLGGDLDFSEAGNPLFDVVD